MNRITSWTLSAVLAVASVAQAQDTTETTTTTTTETTESTAVNTGGETEDQVRFRGGFSVGGGIVFGLGTAPAFMAQGRFGAQINRMFSVFYQPTGMVAVGATGAGTAAVSVSAVVTSQNSIIANLTLADVFEVGVGPSIDYLAAGAATAAGPTAAMVGMAFGVDGRIAWIPNGATRGENGRRKGFSMVVNLHPIFAAGTVIFPITLGLGADWF